jgi:hypothetical protein
MVDTINDPVIGQERPLYTPMPVDSPQYSPIPPMPAAPNPSGFTTPSTMTPLFPSERNSFSSVNDSRLVNTQYLGRDGYNVNVSNIIRNPVDNQFTEYPVPAAVPYFNGSREFVKSTKAIVGLNASNEDMM